MMTISNQTVNNDSFGDDIESLTLQSCKNILISNKPNLAELTIIDQEDFVNVSLKDSHVSIINSVIDDPVTLDVIYINSHSIEVTNTMSLIHSATAKVIKVNSNSNIYIKGPVVEKLSIGNSGIIIRGDLPKLKTLEIETDCYMITKQNIRLILDHFPTITEFIIKPSNLECTYTTDKLLSAKTFAELVDLKSTRIK
jgi:hypothetical protein